MQLRIAVLGGDGVGSEVSAQAVKCLKAINETFHHDFRFSYAPIGETAIAESGQALPDKTIEICRKADAILLGTLDRKTNLENDILPQDSLGKLRKELGLFVNIRPVKLFPSITTNTPFKLDVTKKVDFQIYREQLGGLYNGESEYDSIDNTAFDSATYTENEISRIAHLAFKAAKRRSKRLTLVDKANILHTSKLWRTTVTMISKSYPEVRFNCIEIDNAVVQLALNPDSFDIILTDSVFGDVLSGFGSMLIGIQGLLPAASLGDNHCLFEPTHEAFPAEKGKNTINPVAAIFSTIMLLEKFGLKQESSAVFSSVQKAFKNEVILPRLFGGSTHGTSYVGDFIADSITDLEENFNINDENIGLGKSTII